MKSHVATPEQCVRQNLIKDLIENKGFKSSLMVVEKQLDQLPYLKGRSLPSRRCDLICFAKQMHPEHDLFPLLLIECKAVLIDRSAFEQVIGYNHYVNSCFIGVVNAKESWLGWAEGEKGYQVSVGIPSYKELVSCARQRYGW